MKYIVIFYKIRSKLPLSNLRKFTLHLCIHIILYSIEIYANTSSVHLKQEAHQKMR